MILVKFLFVLLLLVPIAVLMIYYINKLAVEFAALKKTNEKKVVHDRHDDFKHQASGREQPQRRSSTSSKRKKRKERKIKKKDREQ